MSRTIAVEKLVRTTATQGRWVRSLWLEIRPWQWTKNLIVLAPLLFSQSLFSPVAVKRSVTAFFLFCLVSSSVYVLNDLKDREQDRLHPEKRHRPIASGEVGIGTALELLVILLLGALVGGVMVGKNFTFIILSYWLTNFLYSTWLKHLVILDVFAIAFGFVLRVVGGGVAIEVEISHWLLLCTTLLALFLGFGKRRSELTLLGETAGDHRQVLVEYSRPFLDMMIGIVTACTVMSYALYTVSEETVNKFHTEQLLLTSPFVLYGIFRYLYLMYHRDEGGDPTQSIFADIPMVINLCLWALTVGVILYSR